MYNYILFIYVNRKYIYTCYYIDYIIMQPYILDN